MSTRLLAERSGWSRSTISELRSGRRLPSAQQLADLLGAAGVAPDEIASWEQLRQACASPTSSPPEPDDTSDPEDPSPQLPRIAPAPSKRRRGKWAAAGVLAILLAATGGFFLGRATSTSTGAVTPTPAVVANTENLGVTTYTGPKRGSRAPGTIPEGTRILIVCQVGNGEPLTDRVDGTIVTWPVWDKLDDGRWIPDIYTNTSKSYRPTATATTLLTC